MTLVVYFGVQWLVVGLALSRGASSSLCGDCLGENGGWRGSSSFRAVVWGLNLCLEGLVSTSVDTGCRDDLSSLTLARDIIPSQPVS
jgi:hypothetical protein